MQRRRKSGTVVTGRSPHQSLRLFFQYFRLQAQDGSLLRSQVRMLACGIHAADEAERSGLALPARADVLRIHRIRLVAGEAVMHDRLTLDAARVPDFPTGIESVPALLYLFLLERYGIRISAVRERLTAELATAEDADLLGVASEGPVLVINEVAHDQADVPTILAKHRATTTSYCYINEVR